ncbi:hypothetical protein RIR_e66780_A0A2I1E519_9GLOM [Rhizophagus irregularis DAOM 181602=DAOM 197198]|nr:hypothetical protein RIR_e66780_A0A2I1E519_9GLOM [Rhizophagus irregularis DAOM 181602=DAOM 197198]
MVILNNFGFIYLLRHIMYFFFMQYIFFLFFLLEYFTFSIIILTGCHLVIRFFPL